MANDNEIERIPRISEMKESGAWQDRYISAPGLIEILGSLKAPTLGIEIGVAAGENICHTLDHCPNIRHIYAIDPWEPYEDTNGEASKELVEESHACAIDNFKTYGARVQPYRCTSDHFFGLFGKSIEVDYVFIDGNHDYEYVYRDIANFYNMVRVGGIISGHDVHIGHVLDAIDNFAGTLSYKPLVHKVPNCAWWFKKEK